MGKSEVKFLLVDDDVACRRMLGQIIEEESLGEIVDEKDNGVDLELMVLKCQPDIIIIDLLMPEQDGITTAMKLKKWGYAGSVVMLSQVKEKAIIAQAYKVGIELFITKPINKVEVVSVLKRVLETQMLRNSIKKVKESLAILETDQAIPQNNNISLENIKTKAIEILSDLGIAGEAGSQHLIEIVSYIWSSEEGENNFSNLKKLYCKIAEGQTPDERRGNVQAVEQRIRRAIKSAMENIAAIGLEDYHDPKFEFYASRYFEFNELRQKMKELEHYDGYQARINIKKFISGLYYHLKSQLN